MYAQSKSWGLYSWHKVKPVPSVLWTPPVFMDRISRNSTVGEGIWFGNLRISFLHFLLKMGILLVFSAHDRHWALERFSAECEAARMRVSSFKSEAKFPGQRKEDCSALSQGSVSASSGGV